MKSTTLLHKAIPALCIVLITASAAAQQKPISSICVEVESGLVLTQQEADIQRPPASMVKMMMMLMVSEGVEQHSWDLTTPIHVSKFAASMGGTQVFLKEGEVWPLGHMMNAIAVASANDASVAVAETLWGSQDAYLQLANMRALELGMIDTTFRSANGLPPADGKSFDITTARDMAMLARQCVDRPMIMSWVNQKEIRFRPTDAAKSNTNKLLWRMEGCDGLKTGFIRAAGFCIAATAERNGIRLVSVVMGNPGKWERFDQAQRLLEEGFANVRRFRVVAQGQPLGSPVPVSNCAVPSVQLTALADLWVTVRERDLPHLKVTAKHPAILSTPIAAGSVVGEVRVEVADAILSRGTLTVAEDLNPETGLLTLREHLTMETSPAPITKRAKRLRHGS